MVIYLELGTSDLHMVQIMPLPSIMSCFITGSNAHSAMCWYLSYWGWFEVFWHWWGLNLASRMVHSIKSNFTLLVQW